MDDPVSIVCITLTVGTRMKQNKENLLELLYGKQPPGLPKSSKVPNGHQEVYSSTANVFFFFLTLYI